MNKKVVYNLLGRILLIEAALMLLPLAAGLLYGEAVWRSFGIPIALLVAVGLPLMRSRPERQAFYAGEGFFVVSVSWILMSLFGALPLWLSGEVPSYLDCFFEIVSGFTTTGASILPDVEALSKSILLWRSFTHWIGGMGVLVFLLAIVPTAGQHAIHLMRAESPGPSVGKLAPKLRDTASILYRIYIALTVILIALLCLLGMSFYDSLIHAFGTAGTGGFSNYAASVGHFNSPAIEWVITVFLMLFGTNFNLFYLVLTGHALQAWRSEELRWYLCIAAGSTALISINIWRAVGGLGTTVRNAAFQVASIMTTAGFATVDFNLWPMFSKSILLLLMVIGACAGSTGGGIKVSRLILMVKAAAKSMQRMLHPRAVTLVRMDGKPVEEPVLDGVFAYLVCYLGLLAGSVLLLSLEPISFEAVFSGVLCCLNNIGPGLDVLGPAGNFAGLSNLSKLVLSLDMLVGRLEIFPMLMLLRSSFWR